MKLLKATNHLDIIYEEDDVETAVMLKNVCEKTEDMLRIKWNLTFPIGTQVHIMRSWIRFPFAASSWPRKVMLALTFPLWAARAKKLWTFTGGWALPYPRQPAIGVKPPDLLSASDRSMGQRIFAEGMDDNDKIRMITCHELTHASAALLKLPAWLNEGVAMIAVDEYFGYNTVKLETLSSVKRTQPKVRPRDYSQLHRADKDTLIYLYVRGYWMTRYFSQVHPDILSDILTTRHNRKTIIHKLADALKLPSSEFWQRIDDIVVEYHEQSLEKVS